MRPSVVGLPKPKARHEFPARGDEHRRSGRALPGALPSRDNLEISAFLYVPYNLKKNRRNPAIVYVHGGPSSQYMNGFNRSVQYLVNNGYVVIAPNYRGSTGYGKDFEERNRFDMGGGDLCDVVEAARFIESTGYVDRERIALMGGSYWRLHDHDGADQAAGSLGRRRGHRALRELVHRAGPRGSGPSRMGPGYHGRSGR